MSFKFMTLLKYSSKGNSENAKKSKVLVGLCKNGNISFAENVSSKIKELNAENYFDDSVLIPIPRSSPLVPGAVFPSKILSDNLVKNGLGNSVYPILNRVKSITKSSNNYSAETRPTIPTHLDSLSVDPIIILESTLILIDDVFTLGRTAMASAIKLKENFPNKDIKIFCPFRTRSFLDDNILVSLEMGEMTLSIDGNGVKLPN
ncbi:hypothetical protein N5D03_13685 [Empedobacter sp. GD03861]|nr:hypothetical protein [Empedobacter sp. GD03861]MDH0675590.1 hypothetical protein [Empedobacter sp. GD03861]